MFSRKNLLPLIALSLLSLVPAFGLSLGGAQSDEKRGREVAYRIPKHLPIKVKVRKPEKLKDAENEDWLGDLEVEVTNTGTKPIYQFDISVYLPDVFAPNGHNVGYTLSYGRGALVSISEPVRPDDVPLQPGGVVVLSLRADEVDSWKRVRAKGVLTNPKKIEFIFNGLNFGDGTGFVGSDGRPLPEIKERGANAPCGVGDSDAVGAASAVYPLRSYFPDIASLATYLPRRPASRRPFFLVNPLHPPRR
jgi:hypothetical protein